MIDDNILNTSATFILNLSTELYFKIHIHLSLYLFFSSLICFFLEIYTIDLCIGQFSEKQKEEETSNRHTHKLTDEINR
jgi:hypothetical protein